MPVAELQQRMSSKEFAEWKMYLKLQQTMADSDRRADEMIGDLQSG